MIPSRRVSIMRRRGVPPDSQSFVYTAVSGGKPLVFSLTPNGLVSVTLDTVQVASGSLLFQAADVLFGSPVPTPDWSGVSKRLYVLGPSLARVVHTLNGLEVTWLYSFSGEDVTISVHVDNASSLSFMGARIYGLTWAFADASWSGIGGPPQNLNTLAQRGRGFHPSFDCRFGGCYAQDGVYGVGFSQVAEPAYTRTVFCWEYEVKGSSSAHTYNVLREIPYGGSANFQFKMRVSANTDRTHLLTPYRDYFHATYGAAPAYVANPAPLGQNVAIAGAPVYDAGNPYGYQWYRFDVAEGVKGVNVFLADALPLLATANAQGMIVWQLCGAHFGGYTYTPEFDVLPPEVEANIPAIVAAFAAAGLTFGTHARPSEPVVRKAWQPDNTAYEEALFQLPEPTTDRVDEASRPLPSTVMGDRFARMVALGLSLFYLDSFGATLSDHWMVKRIRARLGANVLLAGEYWSDVDLVQMAGYGQVQYIDGTYRLSWPVSTEVWELTRWMVSGVQVVATPQTRNAADALGVWQWMKDEGVTPMFYVGSAQSAADAAKIGELWP